MTSGSKLGKSRRPDEGSFADFSSDESDGIEAYTFADEVKKRVSELGINEPHRPRLEESHKGIFHGLDVGQYFDGRLPTVIRSLTLDQLSALYSLYSNYYAYLVFQTKMAGVEKSESGKQKEFIWSHIRSQYKKLTNDKGKRVYSDQAASDEARHDRRFVEYNSKYASDLALYEVLDAMCQSAEQDMKVISREVTIQQEKLKQQAFKDGFGRRGEHVDNEVGGTSYGQAPEDTGSGPTPGKRVTRPRPPKSSGRTRARPVSRPRRS